MSIWMDGGFVFRILAGGGVVMRRGGKWPASKRLYLLIRLGPKGENARLQRWSV